MKMGLSSVDRWRRVACMFDLEGLLSIWSLERGRGEETQREMRWFGFLSSLVLSEICGWLRCRDAVAAC